MKSSPKTSNKRMDTAGILCLNERAIFRNKQKTARKWRAGDIPKYEPEENNKAGRENNESGTGYEELPEPGQHLGGKQQHPPETGTVRPDRGGFRMDRNEPWRRPEWDRLRTD